ncbi:hypothetical protein RchiOBHm_Chr2g0123681 [Rosa chinensis]|uniref:Uncharacterized protein n=1 Tax=Rosa chinensis TaxID=74649 RepID=A0A2P6RT54_ROSCH|nr:hypothetical protein RchiOBHm_Chr2g0123681 [Rosa chinensis]
MLVELARREKIAGIKPDGDLDIFMKSLALGEKETSLVVEYIMKVFSRFQLLKFLLCCIKISCFHSLSSTNIFLTKILGLDICAETGYSFEFSDASFLCLRHNGMFLTFYTD